MFLHLAPGKHPEVELQLRVQLELLNVTLSSGPPSDTTAEQHSLHHTAYGDSLHPIFLHLPELLCLQQNSLHSSDFIETAESTGTLNRSMLRAQPMPPSQYTLLHYQVLRREMKTTLFINVLLPELVHGPHWASSKTGKNAFNEMESYRSCPRS